LTGPLRDIQLLGLWGADHSPESANRFVPAVYGLGKPRHDRQTLIFWLINGSLDSRCRELRAALSPPAISISPSELEWRLS